MARIRDSDKSDLEFWLDEKGNIKYFKKCARCANSCKQSYRCKEVDCPHYKRR
nr:MAG TPA: zinc finger protein [Caudoviricetes sp.]